MQLVLKIFFRIILLLNLKPCSTLICINVIKRKSSDLIIRFRISYFIYKNVFSTECMFYDDVMLIIILDV